LALFYRNCRAFARASRAALQPRYTHSVQKKIFWMTFAGLGLVADLVLPFWWAVAATVPILVFSWWFAFRSDWFD
jgi:hypothetical protein